MDFWATATCLILGKTAYAAHNANESNASAGSMLQAIASMQSMIHVPLHTNTYHLWKTPWSYTKWTYDLLPLNSLPTRWPLLFSCHSTVVLEVSSEAWHTLTTAGLVSKIRPVYVYLGLLLVPACLDPCGSCLIVWNYVFNEPCVPLECILKTHVSVVEANRTCFTFAKRKPSYRSTHVRWLNIRSAHAAP